MKPTHRLKYLNKVTGEKGDLGAAWLNANGSISLKLNTKVVLTQTADEVLTIFPLTQAEQGWDSSKYDKTPPTEG